MKRELFEDDTLVTFPEMNNNQEKLMSKEDGKIWFEL